MRHIRLYILILFGCALIAGGVGMLWFDSQPVYAQEEEGDESEESSESEDNPETSEETDEALEYVGSRECFSCHRDMRAHTESAHGLALQENEDAILADFSTGEDVRQIQIPGEDALRPFTAKDIAFTIGTGRHVQRYLYEVEEGSYRVLPAEWNTETGVWQPYLPAESWDDPAYDFGQNCAYCHTTGLNIETYEWEEDGVQCETCHGPGSEHAELADDMGRRASDEERAATRAAINPGIDPQVCGQCHSTGTGADNRPYPAGYIPGETLTDSFTLSAPEDTAHWWATGHASHKNMQYNEWLSGHANALKVVQENDFNEESCLGCHSGDYVYTSRLIAEVEAGDREAPAPDALTVETAQYGVTCVSCHNPHSEEGRPANLVAEPYALCVSCHTNQPIGMEHIHHPSQEMYEGVAFVEGIPAEPGIHFSVENGPDCLTCHYPEVSTESGLRDSHALNPVMPGEAVNLEGLTDSCSVCHEALAEPVAMQQLIDDIQADTRARIDAARAAVTVTTPAWVTQALDFVEGDGSLGIHNYAYSDRILDAVYKELGLYGTNPQAATEEAGE
jgi:predicted CXXCH cytochrome family protein